MKKSICAIMVSMGIIGMVEGMEIASIKMDTFSAVSSFCGRAVSELQNSKNGVEQVEQCVQKKIEEIVQSSIDSYRKVAFLEKMDAELKDNFAFITELVHDNVKRLLNNQDIYKNSAQLAHALWRGTIVSDSIADPDTVLRVLKLLSGRDNEFLMRTVYPLMKINSMGLYVPEVQ